MKSIKLSAYAKINLFLEITDKRDDGYHNISSVMHSVSLADTVTLTRNTSRTISLTCNDTNIPADRRNLAWKAAELFFETANRFNEGLAIDIIKRIPTQAGLGGGSSDAAAVLRGLNKLYPEAVTYERLFTGAATLGADIPFCLNGSPMLCEGIGEKMTPVFPMADCYIVIAKSREGGSSTPSAYSAIDALEGREVLRNEMPHLLESQSLDGICKGMYNCFEKAIPVDNKIHEIMTDYGSKKSMMTGSGNAVFGIFTEIQKAEQAVTELADKGYFAALTIPINTNEN